MGNVGLGVSKIFVSYYVRTGIKQFMQELKFDKFGSTVHVQKPAYAGSGRSSQRKAGGNTAKEA